MVGVEFVLRKFALELCPRVEDGEVKSTIRGKQIREATHHRNGVREQLQGEGWDGDRLIGWASWEGKEVTAVQGGGELLELCVLLTQGNHLGGVVEAFEWEAVFEKGQKESA